MSKAGVRELPTSAGVAPKFDPVTGEILTKKPKVFLFLQNWIVCVLLCLLSVVVWRHWLPPILLTFAWLFVNDRTRRRFLFFLKGALAIPTTVFSATEEVYEDHYIVRKIFIPTASTVRLLVNVKEGVDLVDVDFFTPFQLDKFEVLSPFVASCAL